MWKRALRDSLSFFDWKRRLPILFVWGLGAFIYYRWQGVEAVLGEVTVAICFGLIPVAVFLLGLYIFYLIRAPVHIKYEKEKIPNVAIKPNIGRRRWNDGYHEHQHLMWVELEITNTSPILPLEDAEVQIKTLVDVVEKQGATGEYQYLLYSIPQLDITFNPTGICWSERFALPNTLKLTIPPNSTRSALVAFSDDSNGLWSVFNAPVNNKPRHLHGARIEIEVSSRSSPIWRGLYYIQCHPNYTDGTKASFEFVEWDYWANSHNIIGM